MVPLSKATALLLTSLIRYNSKPRRNGRGFFMPCVATGYKERVTANRMSNQPLPLPMGFDDLLRLVVKQVPDKQLHRRLNKVHPVDCPTLRI